MIVLTVLDAQLSFHALVFQNRKVTTKMLNIVQKAVDSTLAVTQVQLVRKARDPLTQSCYLRTLRVAIHSYRQINIVVIKLKVLSQLSDSFVQPKQEDPLFEARPPLQGPDGVGGLAKNRSLEAREMVRVLSYLMLEKLSEVISNDSLCNLRDE